MLFRDQTMEESRVRQWEAFQNWSKFFPRQNYKVLFHFRESCQNQQKLSTSLARLLLLSPPATALAFVASTNALPSLSTDALLPSANSGQMFSTFSELLQIFCINFQLPFSIQTVKNKAGKKAPRIWKLDWTVGFVNMIFGSYCSAAFRVTTAQMSYLTAF